MLVRNGLVLVRNRLVFGRNSQQQLLTNHQEEQEKERQRLVQPHQQRPVGPEVIPSERDGELEQRGHQPHVQHQKQVRHDLVWHDPRNGGRGEQEHVQREQHHHAVIERRAEHVAVHVRDAPPRRKVDISHGRKGTPITLGMKAEAKTDASVAEEHGNEEVEKEACENAVEHQSVGREEKETRAEGGQPTR